MATTLDTTIRPKVVALLALYGTAVAFTDKPGSYSRATGAASAGASLGSVQATPPEGYESRYVDGDVVKAGDSRIYIAGQGLTFTPAAGQKFAVGGITYHVVSAKPIYSGDQVAAWEVQGRRG